MRLVILRHRLLLVVVSFMVGMCLALVLGLRDISTIALLDAFNPSDQLMMSWQDLSRRNSVVVLLLIAGGVLGGVPTIVLLALNGFLVGNALSVFASSEMGIMRFLLSVGPHGVLEMSGLVCAGTVGLGIAAHLLDVFGVNLGPPSFRSLLCRGLTAGLLMLPAAWIEVNATPKVITLLWDAEVVGKAEILIRWCTIVAIQVLSIWMLFGVYNAIGESPGPGIVRILAIVLPLWSTVVAGICIVVYEYYFVAWRTANATWAALAFVMLCGLPSLLYGAARNYTAHSKDVGTGFWVHIPWMLLAVVYLLIGYGTAAALDVFLPNLHRPASILLCAMTTTSIMVLASPALSRQLLAETLPIDWSDQQYLDTATLLDQLRYSRDQVRLIRLRNGKLVNAIASGILPGSRQIILTTDLVACLLPRELAAVVAHEIGHHRRRHLQIGAMVLLLLTLLYAAGIAVLESLALGWGSLGWMVILLWMALFVLLAVPATLAFCFRFFESQADAHAARHGLAGELASALERISSANNRRQMNSRIARLLAFHPPRQKRIEQLRSYCSGK